MSKKKPFQKSRKTIKDEIQSIEPDWEPNDDEKIDFETAESICGDLPDGAYFAMMEELTGMDPFDIAMHEQGDD